MDIRSNKRLTEEDIIQVPAENDDLSSGLDTQNDDDYRQSNDEQEKLVPDDISSSEESVQEFNEATAPSSQFREQPSLAPGQPDLDDVPLSQRTKR
ncbi:hypothetical protein QYM36_004981 [Artemia franciscana]|uniref:Uncharacterized protein n=1 Tax=Artemia franciscana TaxID=6661 RepID=A0AA88HY94_ARTSF|nr:hypothetical protein QYM36_004981 [Artemia franciscana]